MPAPDHTQNARAQATAHERALHYPLGDALPAPGHSLEVAPGVRWLRMALPFALDHINLWLLRDRESAQESGQEGGREGWTVVDCGIDNAATRAAWETVFAQELQGLPVLRVVVTHMHPDHIGLAHWLTERWQCRLWVSATDWQAARQGSRGAEGRGGDDAAAFFARHGMGDVASQDAMRRHMSSYAHLVPRVPGQYRRLLDGLVLRAGAHEWHCKVGYGHAPEHMALHCPLLNTLIAGDMVLPRISTNVSVQDSEPEGDPLALYLASIDALRALPAGTLVLPSHGRPFVGLHTRIAQLVAHHDERLAEALQACRQAPCSAAELLPVLFRRQLDAQQTPFAMGESLAHLHALRSRGQVRAVSGSDGVTRFAAV